MQSLKRIGIACALFTNAMWGITGCLPHNGRLGAGGDGSVLASIGGVSEKDKDRAFLYELVCGAVRVKGEAKADKDFVRFPGDKIKDNDECAMEIRVSDADAAKLDKFTWNGVRSDGSADVGLFYGSDLQKVNANKLSLTLYSLASELVDDSFTVKVNIKFEAGATLPDEALAKGSLVCSETEKYAGDYKKETGALDAVLVFANLDPAKIAKSCGQIAVLVNNVVTFVGDSPDVKLEGVKKDDFKIFPDDKDETKRYLVKFQAAGGGDVDTSTTGGGVCLKYENNVCKDVRVSTDLIGDLPYVETYVLARIQGKAGDQGATKTFLVAASEGELLGRIKTKSFNVSDLNDTLKAGDKKFLFFKDASDVDLTKPAFDGNFLAAKHLTAATADDLKDFKVLHFAKIFVHGMHKVDAAALNAAVAPTVWFTKVKATKDAIVSEFLVTGKTAQFTSTSAPLTVDGKAVYFDFAKLTSEMAVTSGSDKWKVYALQSGAMSSADCKFDLSVYVQTPSLITIENMPTINKAEFDKCEVSQAKFDQALATGFSATTESYVWEWFVPMK